MKHIKLYDHNINKPEKGDYVICDATNFDSLKSIIDSNIGVISDINNNRQRNGYNIDVDYINVLEQRGCFTVNMMLNEILYWSKDKKELEEILVAKKYNL